MTKGIGNKRYTPEFKKIVVETMREEGLSYKETRLRFDIAGEDRVRNWERIYLEEGPEGLAVERRGRKITGRPRKLPQSTEEDLIAENQRLRAEVAYLKNFASLGFGARATPAEKTLVVQNLRGEFALSLLLEIAQLPRASFYYHLKQMKRADKYETAKAEITAIYHENKVDMDIAALPRNYGTEKFI